MAVRVIETLSKIAYGHSQSKIKRLALIAPLWLRETPGRIDPGGDLPAYREVDLWKYEESWRAAAPKDQRDALIPPGWFGVWAENTLAIGPRGTVPNTILAPSGAIQDIREYWAAGRPIYDPGENPRNPCCSFMRNDQLYFVDPRVRKA